MTKPASQRWQKWRHAARVALWLAMWLPTCWPTSAIAIDLSNVGEESRGGLEVAAQPTEAALVAQSPAAVSRGIQSPPMYRLPITEEPPSEAQQITPLEEPVAETWPNAKTQSPMVTALPPCDEATAPRPAEPTSETAGDMNAVWSEGFEAAPTPEPGANDGVPTVTPYAPTTAQLSRQLLPTVRKGYGLAQHGAVFAAQTEFIQVLRRIAEAKDAAEGVDTHARALAAGLRALDEADDFAPQGAQLEAELDVAVLVSAHRTPVLRDQSVPARPVATRPAEAIALYHQYARQQLAHAVAGEQAGSMALYGLGKVQNRLAYEADGELGHERKALTMFLAALDAGPGNHLAANEIGVLLSRGGHPAEASLMFRRAIDIAPTSTTYHNLAVTDRALGYHDQAIANEQYAWQLAQRDRTAGAASRARGVQWVAPQELTCIAQPMPNEADNSRAASAPQRPPQPADPGAVQTAAKWPQKLVPGIFRR